MDITPPFLLQRATMVQIIASLIRRHKPIYNGNSKSWQDVDKAVINTDILTLRIPTILQKELIEMAKHISPLYRNAREVFLKHCPNAILSSIHDCIVISPLATVDYKKSAQALMRLSAKEIPCAKRYLLSRIYGLEEPLRHLQDLEYGEGQELLMYLSVGLRGPEESLAERHLRFLEASRGYSDLVYVGLEDDGRDAYPYPEVLAQILNYWRFRLPPCLCSLFVQLMKRYPGDQNLKTMLMGSRGFLYFIFQWPYLDVLSEMLQMLRDRNTRVFTVHDLLNDVFTLSKCARFLDDLYLDIYHPLWKELVSIDPEQNCQWNYLAEEIIQHIIVNSDAEDYEYVPLFKLLLEDLDESEKMSLCKDQASCAEWVFENGRQHCFFQLFNLCLTGVDQKMEFKIWLSDNSIRIDHWLALFNYIL